MIRKISGEELAKAEQEGALVEFYTPTCAFCKEMDKTLTALAEENQGLSIFKVDVSEETEVASRLKIRSVPTLIRFEKGTVSEKLVGNASKADISARFFPQTPF